MKTYLLNVWDKLRASFWFVPSLFAAGAVVLSLALPRLDATIAESTTPLPESIRTTTETARTLLSAIAGAMVTVTGTVFSITIVTLSLTSQQFGPRLLRRFMYDVPTQITLGVFLSTGFYCLLVLRFVEQTDGGAQAPHLAVVAAVVLALFSMVMLIYFIHHVAMLIQAPHVVAAVARDLDDAIDRLFPEKIGRSPEDSDKEPSRPKRETELGEPPVVVLSSREGYVQAIDGDGAMNLARERDLVLRLRSRPGSFIAIDQPLADVWPAGERTEGEVSAEQLRAPLNETVIVGVRRTPRQDVECAIDELVELAVRALSPGVNDPFTAVNCIDRLGAALGRLARRKRPDPYRCDDDGRLRVIVDPDSFTGALDAAFNQIRQHARDSVSVTIRLLEALGTVAGHARRERDRQAVRLHAEMVARHAESFDEEHDRREVRERMERIARRLDQESP